LFKSVQPAENHIYSIK